MKNNDLELWKFILGKVLDSKIFNAKSLHFDYSKLNQELVNISKTTNDNGIVLSVHAHLWGALFPIIKFGRPDQVEKYSCLLSSGVNIGALAYTDDKNSPLVYTKNSDGTFKLNGKKRFITNAPIADYFIVYARNNENLLTAFLISKNINGIKFLESKKLIGLNSSSICDVLFQDCSVYEHDILGKDEGNGTLIFNACIEKERLFLMSSILGRMFYLKDLFLKSGGENKVFDHYPAQVALADLENAIYISTCVIGDAIKTLQNGENVFLKSAQVKIIVSSFYQELVRSIVQSLGAVGLENDLGLSLELRDSVAASLYSGSNEVLKKIIYRYVKR